MSIPVENGTAIVAFIRDNLRLQPAPSVPEIMLYAAHSGSRLGRLPGNRSKADPPYWAYHWAGGSVLARHILEHPQMVSARRVLDFGTGSGIVAIAAAKSGAAHVMAVDTDPNAIAAARLNAQANGVEIEFINADILDTPPTAIDIILAGDVFYSRPLARRVLPFLRGCADQGISVLIGDPGRRTLPRSRLRLVAEYPVLDFGAGEVVSGVYVVRGHR